MSEREFMPIMLGSDLDLEVHVKRIPWAMIAHAERQSQENHSQSLDKIASRGGFDATEAIAVISGLPWRPVGVLDTKTAHRILYHMVVMFNRGQLVAQHRLARTQNEATP